MTVLFIASNETAVMQQVMLFNFLIFKIPFFKFSGRIYFYFEKLTLNDYDVVLQHSNTQ